MSSGGYDAPHLPSAFPRYEPRRTSISGIYERPPPSIGPPSPTSARQYDRYVPPPVANYREEYSGAYRPMPFRPEYPPTTLYSRSPSPDRYAAAPGAEQWERQNYWPPSYNRPLVNHGWQERKPVVPPSPTASVRSRGQSRDDTLAAPMFEPSENWKQKQGPERYNDPARLPVAAIQRPPPTPPSLPTRAEYRPERSTYHPETNSYRRDQLSVGSSRLGDHHEPQRAARFSSRSRSPGGHPNDHNLVSSPVQSDWRVKPRELSRKSSSSSIASTHVSSSVNVDSSRHSRQPSDSLMTRSGSSSGAGNLLGRHRSPSSSQLPGLSALVTVKPDPDSPGLQPSKSVDTSANGANGNAQVTTLAVNSTMEAKVNGEAPMDLDMGKDITRLPTPRQSESRSNVVPSPDVQVASAAREESPREAAVLELPAAPAHCPPKSPLPSVAWQDTSGVLLELKPLFPPEALPTSEPPAPFSATTFSDALRAVVRLRLISDRQTRDEIVDLPLKANQAIAAMNVLPYTNPRGLNSTPESFTKDVLGGANEERRLEQFKAIRPSLVDHFEQRQAMVTSKVERLSKEYLQLHEKWRAHCALLSEHQKSRVHTTEHEASQYVAGRTTRHRGALADAVRSDLEMEQIIASLESNDATDPNYLSMRNAARIPDMISVTKGQVDCLFDDTNHLVEDPMEYYAVKSGIDDWTDEEKRIFIDKFAQFPKQFGMIAEFIPHKTANQCVDYYYLHKKRQIDFRKVVAQLGPKKKRRGGGRKKKGNALLTDIAQHDAEVGKLPSSFVVPSRVTKGRRAGKVKMSTAGANSATATPQPEPRSARLQAQAAAQAQLAAEAAAATTPPTPEPESIGRTRRRGKYPAASASAPVSVSASISASSAPMSTSVPRPSPLASAIPSIAPTPATTAPDIPFTPGGGALLPSPAPTPAVSVVAIPATIHPQPIADVASSQSVSSSLTKMEEDDMEFDTRPTKKPKRTRKQVKSVAIIHDEPPSPPPESELPTPSGEGEPEPSSVLTKATKILSELEVKRGASTSPSASEDKAKGKAKSMAKAKDKDKEKGSGKAKGKEKAAQEAETEESTANTKDLPEAEKSRWT